MQKPISLLDELPPASVMDTGEEECWWWHEHKQCWVVGSPLLFSEDSIKSEDNPYGVYTHWLPYDAIFDVAKLRESQ